MIKILLIFCFLITTKALADGRYGVASLHRLSMIQSWASQNPERFWIKGEDKVFYFDPSSRPGRQPFAPGFWKILKGELYFYYGAHTLPHASREILQGGRIRLIESTEKLTLDFTPDQHGDVRPIKRNHSLVERLPKTFEICQTMSISASLDAEQWFKDIETLASWNRYSYSSEIDLSRLWLIEQFEAMESYSIEDFSFPLPRGEGANVIARIEGQSRPDDVYIVGAHYDSISERPSMSAPGAEDNASGTAGLLALARLFAQYPPEATIIFIAFSGEEQGLFGSRAWLKNTWLKEGTEAQIKAVFIMDMIGYSGDAELDVLLETSRLTRPLLADIQSVNRDPDLVVSESFDYWGSDHEPFLDNNVPAILFIEDDYLWYPDYHRSTDTISKIHPSLGPKILSLMADSLALWVY